MAVLGTMSGEAYYGATLPAPDATTVGSLDANLRVIDGTPIRVVVLAVSAALGLTALKMAGFRFNVGVST